MDPERRRAQILAAASRRFRRDGYAAVSMDDVAADAGVARGLLNHYFGSKRDLYLAVVEREVGVPASVPVVPAGTSGDLESVLAVCVDWWLDLVEQAGVPPAWLWSTGAPPALATDRWSRGAVGATIRTWTTTRSRRPLTG